MKTALAMARLTAIKTLQGFDFGFQPSLDRERILALAELKFIDRAQRSSIFSAHPAREKATSPRRSPSRQSKPGAASPSRPWPISSPP